MHIAIIGGTGHIGSYLTPMLFDAGYQVTCVCRGQKKPYREHKAWKSIRYAKFDRAAEESTGSFGQHIAGIGADVVIDLTCYRLESAAQLVHNALRGRVQQLHALWKYLDSRTQRLCSHDRKRASGTVWRLRHTQGGH